ncbi:MAG: carbon monoxide dehydrogenase subunit G [Anaerolineae bacterium]|nr:carbon monoxide dehydrogenase subunit G [Anaerolineae bacterium]
MELSGDYVFDVPQELVWGALLDPNVLGSIMPGGKKFEQTGEDQFSGVLEVKVGPVQGTFQGQIQLSDIVAPESYSIQVDGKGATGFVKANGKLRLETRSNQTFMEYSGQAQVGGRIASVGQRLMDSAARSIIRQSLEALNAYLTIEAAKQAPPPVAVNNTPAETPAAVRSEASAASALPTEYKPPTQMGLAFNVVRDVFNDLVPAKYQPWLIGAVIIVILLIILLSASR